VRRLSAIAHASLAGSEVSEHSEELEYAREPAEAPLQTHNDETPSSSKAPSARIRKLGMYATAYAVVRMTKRRQKCAEAAVRVDPLNRTPEQLQHIAQYVKGATPFQDMLAPDLLKVARAIVLVRTTANEVVVKEGALGSAFFVVLAGEFAVWQRCASESPYNECVLKPALAARLQVNVMRVLTCMAVLNLSGLPTSSSWLSSARTAHAGHVDFHTAAGTTHAGAAR
jgi:hypothetical protein